MITNEEKLSLVEKAILDLQSGKRVTAVSYGDMRVQYASIDLDKLLELRSQLKATIAGSSGKRQIVFSTSKGLR